MATRMAISRSRLTPRASSRPATLTQPMASTASTAKSSVKSGPFVLLATRSASGVNCTVSPLFVSGWAFGEVGEDVRKVGMRLLDGDPVFEAANRAEPICAPRFCIHSSVMQMRSVDSVVQIQRIAETGGHDADNRADVRPSSLTGLPTISLSPPKYFLPRVITQHSNVVLAVLLFAGQKCAAQKRLHAEDLEEVVGGMNAIQRHRSAEPASRW
jgi:hypothetical protein